MNNHDASLKAPLRPAEPQGGDPGGGGSCCSKFLLVLCCPIWFPFLVLALVLMPICLPFLYICHCTCGSRAKVDGSAPARPRDTFSSYENADAGASEFCTTDGTLAIPPRIAQTGVASVTPQTVLDIFRLAVERKGSRPAMSTERPVPALVKGAPIPAALPLANWTTWTWAQYYEECSQVARSLMHLGVQQHDSVAIYGFNAPEW